MIDQNLTDAAAVYGIDERGVRRLLHFIDSAKYHLALPDVPLDDRKVVIDNAVRRVTQRIACKGGRGSVRELGHRMSQKAMDLMPNIAGNASCPSPARRLSEWRNAVTEEHQDRVDAVRLWWEDMNPASVEILARLLATPSVIITSEENRNLDAGGWKKAGTADERYNAVGILVGIAPQSARSYFGSKPPRS